MAESISAALKWMENRRIFIESLCRNSHTGIMDTAEPYFELVYLPFEEGVLIPRLRDSVDGHEDMPEGFALYYTDQYPLRPSVNGNDRSQ